MSPRTHLVAGVLAGIIYIKYTNSPPIEIMSGTINACKLPDIDQKIHIFKHREFTHSFVIPIGLLYSINYFHQKNFHYVLTGFLIGWLAHMIMDMLNGSGVALFFPISKTRMHIMDIRYNESGERWVFNLLIVLCIVVIIGVGNVKEFILTLDWKVLDLEFEKFIEYLKD